MSNPIKDHFNQPAGLAATTLAFGVLGAWIALFIWSPDARDLVWMLFPFTGFVSLVVIAVRLVRPLRGRDSVAPARCALCGTAGPVTPVRYLQITGVVVVMFMRELPVFACRRCARRAFLEMTLHTLALGWWSLFSLFITPGFVLNNLAFLARSQIAGPGRSGHAASVLEGKRDWALALLATKDEVTVVEVLERDTGLPAAEIERFVAGLRKVG